MRRTSWHKFALILIPLLALSLTNIVQAASVGRNIDDTTITSKVKSKMLAEKGFPASTVHVETDSGKVLLSGHVNSNAEKRRAAEIAKSVDGVKKVENDLTISKS